MAHNLRRIRVEQGISQERLAGDTGIDRAYLGGLERAVGNPTVDLLDRLASALHVHIGAFFEMVKNDEPRPKPLAGGRKAQAAKSVRS